MSHPVPKSLITWRRSHSKLAHAVRNSTSESSQEMALCGVLVSGLVVDLEFSFQTPACPICVTLALEAVSRTPIRPRKLPPRDSYPRQRRKPAPQGS